MTQTNVTLESIQNILARAYQTAIKSYEGEIRHHQGLIELYENSPLRNHPKHRRQYANKITGARRSLAATERKLEVLKKRGRL